MKLLDDLADVVRHIESVLDVDLSDEEFVDPEFMHVFLHEACHAGVSKCVPWIHDLNDEAHTAIDEIMARLLETEVAPKFGLYVHTPEEHVRELVRYPVQISVDQYRHLCSQWQKRY